MTDVCGHSSLASIFSTSGQETESRNPFRTCSFVILYSSSHTRMSISRYLNIDSTLVQCRPIVRDGGPALYQRWSTVSWHSCGYWINLKVIKVAYWREPHAPWRPYHALPHSGRVNCRFPPRQTVRFDGSLCSICIASIWPMLKHWHHVIARIPHSILNQISLYFAHIFPWYFDSSCGDYPENVALF